MLKLTHCINPELVRTELFLSYPSHIRHISNSTKNGLIRSKSALDKNGRCAVDFCTNGTVSGSNGFNSCFLLSAAKKMASANSVRIGLKLAILDISNNDDISNDNLNVHAVTMGVSSILYG